MLLNILKTPKDLQLSKWSKKQTQYNYFTICISMCNEMIWYVYNMHRDK
jgi:hypothetical protein